MRALRARLAALCDQITRHSDMDQAIRDAGAGPQLDELLGAIRDGAIPDDSDHLTTLLNEIEEACARDGLAGVTSRVKQFTPLSPGLRGGLAECSDDHWAGAVSNDPGSGTTSGPYRSVRTPG